MKRHLNYTERDRITRNQASVRIREEPLDDRPVFELTLRVDRARYSDDALVRVEASRSNVVQRWSFGTIANLTVPSAYERRLTDVESSSLFKVFIVEPGTGRLLGLADKIRPIQPIDSLIPLKEDDGTRLGSEVWRVDFGHDEGPVLLVNNNVPRIGDIVRSDVAFRSLVMPQVLRQVLTQMIFVEKMEPDDDEDGWGTDWFTFVDRLGVKAEPDITWGDNLDNEAGQEWIDKAVIAFSDTSLRAARSYGEATSGAS